MSQEDGEVGYWTASKGPLPTTAFIGRFWYSLALSPKQEQSRISLWCPQPARRRHQSMVGGDFMKGSANTSDAKPLFSESRTAPPRITLSPTVTVPRRTASATNPNTREPLLMSSPLLSEESLAEECAAAYASSITPAAVILAGESSIIFPLCLSLSPARYTARTRKERRPGCCLTGLSFGGRDCSCLHQTSLAAAPH